MFKIISGGQTGVDRIALEVARQLGFPTGGTAPKGFLTERGPNPSLKSFGLVEDRSSSYGPRIRRNVLDADGTVLFGNMDSTGCRSTIRLCDANRKPYIPNPDAVSLVRFIRIHHIAVLNVVGNRASQLTPYQTATIINVLETAFRTIRSFTPALYRKL